MIHHTCDRWKRVIDPEHEARYVVHIQIEVALLNIALNARDAMEGTTEKTLVIRTRNATTEESASHGDLAS